MIVNTINDLMALSPVPSDNHVHVLGYHMPADGGGGDFYWDATSTKVTNGGTIFEGTATVTPTPLATLSTGKWLRYYSESINLKWFGAKGDGTTNDSPAFQSMIDYCEPAGTKDVIIPFGEFYLEESVYIPTGGIKFIGQGSLLRENIEGPSYVNNDLYNGAVLLVKNGISAIVYDTTVIGSVYWRGVSFRSENGRSVGDTYAIDFRSTYGGPTWPFNVHECHFAGFNRVFNFDGGSNTYNIAFMNITNCAFVDNDEVIYQGTYTPTNTRYTCWGLNFENNKCHWNSRVIYGHYTKDLVTIRNNNFEGNNQYADHTDPPYAVDIQIAACSVTFHGNHFEGMVSDCVSITSLTGSGTDNGAQHHVNIYGNNMEGVNPVFKSYTLSGCAVKINEAIPVYVHSCEILENSRSNIFLTEYAKTQGTIIKFTNLPWLSSNFVKDLYNYQIFTNAPDPINLSYNHQAYIDPSGEQWIRTRTAIYDISNGYAFNSDITYCVAVYKVRNHSLQQITNASTRYFSSSVPDYPSTLSGTLVPPLGESLIVCIFPSKYDTFSGLFKSAIGFNAAGSESLEVSSSVFAYLTKSENPEVVPVFEPSNIIGEYGTFIKGQTWYNGTNFRIATASGTQGTLTGIVVTDSSDNKIELNNVDSIAQGQYIDIDDGTNVTTYRIIELRGFVATLDATPSSPIPAYPAFNSVTFHAATFATIY